MTWDGYDDERPEWEPERSGPEYWLNKLAPSRCLMCGMPQRLEVDEFGPIMVCRNRNCLYTERV